MRKYKKKVKENETIIAVNKRGDNRVVLFFVAFPLCTNDLPTWNTLPLCITITGTISGCVSPIGEFCQVDEVQAIRAARRISMTWTWIKRAGRSRGRQGGRFPMLDWWNPELELGEGVGQVSYIWLGKRANPLLFDP